MSCLRPAAVVVDGEDISSRMSGIVAEKRTVRKSSAPVAANRLEEDSAVRKGEDISMVFFSFSFFSFFLHYLGSVTGEGALCDI
jgi:hypothetical protein